MFGNILSCISQLWDVLCESMSSTTTSLTPSSSPSDSIPSATISQTPSSIVSNSLASTSSQAPSSSSSYITRWDVFLSFRGSDTRNKFTSHLYDKLDSNGIRTFKDDPELERGEVISDALLDGIRKSKAYIVVLSENYASSSWCLDELTEILNCYKTMRRLVLPVFYNIDPAVVRYQTGSFKQAFQKHHVRFVGEREKVINWQLTLSEVAGFSGHHISEDSVTVYRPEFLNWISHPQWPDWIIETPYWTSESSNSESTMYAHVLPYESHNFMGMILCFKRRRRDYNNSRFGYSVKNTTSGFI